MLDVTQPAFGAILPELHAMGHRGGVLASVCSISHRRQRWPYRQSACLPRCSPRPWPVQYSHSTLAQVDLVLVETGHNYEHCVHYVANLVS
jgi:hypothetical protein